MALTAEYTKIWPKIKGVQIHIGVEVVLKEAGVEVARQTFPTNTEKTADPDTKAQEVINTIQDFVNNYKAEKLAFDSNKMNNFVTAVTQGVQL